MRGGPQQTAKGHPRRTAGDEAYRSPWGDQTAVKDVPRKMKLRRFEEIYTFTGDSGDMSEIGIQKTKQRQKETIVNSRENKKLYSR